MRLGNGDSPAIDKAAVIDIFSVPNPTDYAKQLTRRVRELVNEYYYEVLVSEALTPISDHNRFERQEDRKYSKEERRDYTLWLEEQATDLKRGWAEHLNDEDPPYLRL